MKPTLYVRHASGTFILYGSFPNYHEAVVTGQTLVGPGKFYVDTGDRAPSRAEQLLEHTPTAKERRMALLDQI